MVVQCISHGPAILSAKRISHGFPLTTSATRPATPIPLPPYRKSVPGFSFSVPAASSSARSAMEIVWASVCGIWMLFNPLV